MASENFTNISGKRIPAKELEQTVSNEWRVLHREIKANGNDFARQELKFRQEEVRPLLVYIKYLYGLENVEIVMHGKNNPNIDATIYFNDRVGSIDVQITCALDPTDYQFRSHLLKKEVLFNLCDPQLNVVEEIGEAAGKRQKAKISEKYTEEIRNTPLNMISFDSRNYQLNLIIQAINNKINRVLMQKDEIKNLPILLVAYYIDGRSTGFDEDFDSFQLGELRNFCWQYSDEICKFYNEIQIVHAGRPEYEKIVPLRIFAPESEIYI